MNPIRVTLLRAMTPPEQQAGIDYATALARAGDAPVEIHVEAGSWPSLGRQAIPPTVSIIGNSRDTIL